MTTRIYLNNAGTSWPKPDAVHDAVSQALRASPDEGAELLAEAEREVAGFLGLPEPERFLFTGGCTAALGLAILDLPWQDGDVVLTSHLEHHALVGPVLRLVRDRGVRHEIAPYRPGRPVDLEFVESVLRRGGVRLVACTMVCNVTGEILPVGGLGNLAQRHGALLLLDGAQAVGVLPTDVGALGADLFVFAGHKGPHGPQGVGGLYVGSRTALRCVSASCSIADAGRSAASALPSYCDTGSANLPAVAGLLAGVRWLRERGVQKVGRQARALAARLRDGLAGIEGIRLHGGADPARCTAVVSLSMARGGPQEIDARLREHGIVGGCGYHCAPLAHEALGTAATGTLRLSCGPHNTADEIAEVVAQIEGIARS